MPVLRRWIRETEADTGVAVARQQRWVSYMLLAAMLDTVQDNAGDPLFLIKGGVAMELRFDVAARATKDLDLAYRAGRGMMLDHLDQALNAGHGQFTARRTEAERIRGTQAVRLDVKLTYAGKPWATVQMEVAPAEAGMAAESERLPAKPLQHLGLTGPDTVPAVSVRWQLAQKLHACTEIFDQGRLNDRFRDLVDIVLLWDLVPPEGQPAVREACEAIFELRQAHPWPPDLHPADHWSEPYQLLADEIRFPITDIHDARAAVLAIIDQITRA